MAGAIGRGVLAPDSPIAVLEEVTIAGEATDGMRWHRAWPSLEILPNGTLVVAFKHSRDHNRSDDAALFIARSTDGGKTWPWRRALAAEPGWGCMTNHGLTYLTSGILVCPVLRYQHFSRPDETTGLSRVTRSALSRSSDGGETWDPCGADQLFDSLHPLFSAAYGKSHELADGRLMVPTYGVPQRADSPRLRTSGVAFSNDVGRTWSDFVPILEDLQGDVCPSETDVIRLADGRYLAMLRANAARRLYRSYSSDEGRTWTVPEATTLPGQCPALLTLASGDLLCAYRDMTEGGHGVACAVSADAGETWVTIGQLYAGESRDCAYPSLVRLSDDRLYCAYYTSASPSHSGACEIRGLVLADRSAS